MNILIVAGGSGTRLWPASRKNKPKQLLAFLGDQTLLQNTYKRSLEWVAPENIYIATTADYAQSVKQQLKQIPASHFSIEATMRDRAPAIGLAALIMHHHDPNSSFMCMWSDHSIKSKAGYFRQLLLRVERFLNANPATTLTVGVTPSFPHTGLGYIEKGAKLANESNLDLYQLRSFKEKPGLAIAKKFVASRRYLWNSGYFAWKTATLLDLYQKHLPEIYDLLMKIKPSLGTRNQQKAINKWYPKMPQTDIERGLLEKVKKDIVTLEGNFSWADIGSWKVIKDVQSKPSENLVKGQYVGHDSSGTLIYNYTNNMLAATLGVKDLIIVVTPEAVLVVDKNRSEEVREIIKQLKSDPKLKKFL